MTPEQLIKRAKTYVVVGSDGDAVNLGEEIHRLRKELQWIGDRANTQLLSEQLDAPRRDHVEMAYDMNACALAALAKTNTI